jgi:hypothetical protein
VSQEVSVNITLAIDDEDLRRVRRIAQQRGTSVQQLIREHLRSMVDNRSAEERGSALVALMERHPGRSGGRKVRRQEAYEERT